MPEDLMRYDQLAQKALRNGVVREALVHVEKQGLPGEHHFYITFNTGFEGVEMSDRMRERYPREMTIVLQHQFEGLRVHESRFEVRLSFDNIPERLVVPFESLKAFFDPAVPFGLQFEVVQAQQAAPAAKKGPRTPAPKAIDTTAVAEAAPEPAVESAAADDSGDGHKIISLDSFRKK